MSLGPRLVIAGTHSGVGKTTVATGIMAALRRRGLRVAPAKVGPDFIDPGYHSLACGRPGRNLDAWMCGAELIRPLAASAARDSDVLIVEGVMGLFDGAADGTPSSTAEIAVMLEAPVVLVIDCSSQAASVAAVVHGFATLDPRVRVAGVVLNQIASDGHEVMVREAVAALAISIPVLGVLRRDDRLSWRDRHLGLVPVAERPDEIGASLDALAAIIDRSCDLEAIVALARTAPSIHAAPVPMPRRIGPARIAIAGGRAFTFAYPDNAEALVAAGAELVPFDPLHDRSLPDDVDALVVGGGFPEVMVDQLSENVELLEDVRRRVGAGLVTWAECGGLLWLARSLDGRPLVAAIDATGTMTDRLTLGYRTASMRTASPLGPAGTRLRGHEFHYSTIDPTGDAIELGGRFGVGTAGFAGPTMVASYLHVHLAGHAHVAEHLLGVAIDARQRSSMRVGSGTSVT